jgi:hypothetical protein
VLALVGSLLGSLAAASRSSGIPFSNEFRVRRRAATVPPMKTGTLVTPAGDAARDQTTILPPTH